VRGKMTQHARCARCLVPRVQATRPQGCAWDTGTHGHSQAPGAGRGAGSEKRIPEKKPQPLDALGAVGWACHQVDAVVERHRLGGLLEPCGGGARGSQQPEPEQHLLHTARRSLHSWWIRGSR
jgi:hypothetical protein